MDSDTRYLGSRSATPRPDNPTTTSALTAPAEIIPASTRRTIRAFVSRNSNILPLALIALGLLIFFGRPNFAVAAVGTTPLSLGLVFLYVYLQQGKQFQFLVPAALLTGLGLGAVAA